jgi:putative tryptophan/tyrosine transport system substrate-binding protein
MHYAIICRLLAKIMKKSLIFFLLLLIFLGIPCLGSAQDKFYRIEVLQVTNLTSFQMAYDGFVKELERNGLIPGSNLIIKRTVIEFDIENASIWKKLKLLVRFKSEASRIVKEKPDLVLTMGTPVTKYTKDKITAAGIPLVFSALAYPVAAGSKSLTEAGPGFTGATSYMNMQDALKLIRKAFPAVKNVGIVHSDDANSIAHIKEAEKEGAAMGFRFLTKQVNVNSRIRQHLEELHGKGADAFIVPPDPYYEIHSFENAVELGDLARSLKAPVISLVTIRIPGAAMYIGPDFETTGVLSGQQCIKILKEGQKPDSLPILSQQDLTVYVDKKIMNALGIPLPPEILHVSKIIE